ncbi:hypothetical protein ACA910_021797 [Epithemia clementina (nom. ined.)]
MLRRGAALDSSGGRSATKEANTLNAKAKELLSSSSSSSTTTRPTATDNKEHNAKERMPGGCFFVATRANRRWNVLRWTWIGLVVLILVAIQWALRYHVPSLVASVNPASTFLFGFWFPTKYTSTRIRTPTQKTTTTTFTDNSKWPSNNNNHRNNYKNKNKNNHQLVGSDDTDVVLEFVQNALGALHKPPISLPLAGADQDNTNRLLQRPLDNSSPPPPPVRHICLQAIRQRHYDAFFPLFLDSDDSIHNHHNNINNNNNEPPQVQEILLVDPAYHPNVGDHMITVAEQALVQTYWQWQRRQRTTMQGMRGSSATSTTPFSSLYYHECSYYQAGSLVPPCRETIVGTGALSSLPSFFNGTNHKIALWHGGGNWGDLWPKIQSLRTQSIPLLLGPRANYTRVVGMPQSLYFTKPDVQHDNALQWQREVLLLLSQFRREQRGNTNNNNNNNIKADNDKDVHGLRHRLILSWREHESFQLAQELYPFATNLLVPDIAFQLGPYYDNNYNNNHDNNRNNNNNRIPSRQRPEQQQQQDVDILFLLRDDHESIYASQRNRQSISTLLSSSSLSNVAGQEEERSFSIVDWPDRLDRFENNNDDDDEQDHEENSSSSSRKSKSNNKNNKNPKNFLFTETAIQLLKLGRVVICDRLHAAILAYLSGLSFVVLDQVSGKIDKTMRVAMESHVVCSQDVWTTTGTTTTTQRPPPPPWRAQAQNLTHGIHLALQMLEAMDNNNDKEDVDGGGGGGGGGDASARRRRRRQRRRQGYQNENQ